MHNAAQDPPHHDAKPEKVEISKNAHHLLPIPGDFVTPEIEAKAIPNAIFCGERSVHVKQSTPFVEAET